MKVVFVSRSKGGKPNPFVQEQADNLQRHCGVEVAHFLINRGGIAGYWQAVGGLRRKIREDGADIVHVHYGLWAFVALLNKWLFFRRQKVVITFHGSDINKQNERRVSLLGAGWASHNILVSEKMTPFFRKKYSVIPCGIDTNVPLHFRGAVRQAQGWTDNDFVLLFSSSFDRPEKDAPFAFAVKEALALQTTKTVHLIELKGLSRLQVTGLMQAADALILCSTREGSPQVVKEAVLNGLPVVANPVGDVPGICEGVDHCHVVEKKVPAFVAALNEVAQSRCRIENRRPVIEKYDNSQISKKLFGVYEQVLQ